MIAISIIVPIYNMEKMMRKCLDSILVQSFQDYECLLIDDGSTDGSPAICDEYAVSDSRFKAFHKPNGGLSDARNYGLALAQGKYTIFFDPDDWADPDCLKDMFAKAHESDADMVICDYYSEDLYHIRYSKQSPTSLSHHGVLRDLLEGRLYGFTWNKLLRASLYRKYNLQYPVGMYGCEDQYTMCALLKHDIKIVYLSKAYYHYMFYGYNTLSKKYDEMTFQMDLRIREMFVELFDDSEMKSLAYRQKSSSILSRAFMFGTRFFSSQRFKNTFKEYKEYVSGSWIERNLIQLSLIGYYHSARRVFTFMYNVKQFFKKVCS
jgi:glycosyltransferase involved in cell wall biosynthesis